MLAVTTRIANKSYDIVRLFGKSSGDRKYYSSLALTWNINNDPSMWLIYSCFTNGLLSLKLDSDLLYELFVPTSFFTDPKVTRPLTVRKINKVRNGTFDF